MYSVIVLILCTFMYSCCYYSPLQIILSEFCCLSVASGGRTMASIWLWAWWVVWWASGTRTERRRWRSRGRVARHRLSGLSPGTLPSKTNWQRRNYMFYILNPSSCLSWGNPKGQGITVQLSVSVLEKVRSRNLFGNP